MTELILEFGSKDFRWEKHRVHVLTKASAEFIRGEKENIGNGNAHLTKAIYPCFKAPGFSRGANPCILASQILATIDSLGYQRPNGRTPLMICRT